MTTYIVNVSSGLGSIEAYERTIEAHGIENTVGVFADVKGNNTNEHAGEDADNYRFLADVERYFDTQFIRIVEGRGIWQVMRDVKAITLPVGATRVARCSIDLKRKPIDAWIDANYAPDTCVQVVGLGWHEPHRVADFEAAKAPYRCWFPLNERPFMDSCNIADKWKARGIQPPRLYDAGFEHANCGGFCVKAGQAHFANLYRWNKERYMYHAEQEAAFQRDVKPGVTILRRKEHGKTIRMSLYEFAERIEAGLAYEHDDWGGCGCFAPVSQGRMDDLILETDIRKAAA